MIRAEKLHKRFGSHEILKGVNLEVQEGESAVIIGASGGGKSVLLKHLIGLIQPDSGRIWIDDREITSLSEREMLGVRGSFAMVFQNAALFDSLTVGENVAFPLRRKERLTEGEIERRVEESLALVNLSGTQAKKPAELSGGMRKRVGIARAIVYRPAIVLYDEPTTGLDPVASDSIDRLIIRVCAELGVTSVAVTHDMRSARRVGQRVHYLLEGRMHLSATPEEIFASTDPLVHRFVNGISEAPAETP